ncbi:MAG TPA: hypothetical protein VNW97_15555 [Candidatus Saccharimonadales bacterium]|jgi:hypothetical protein|nr:hypothetical protein [Candidatus Saccharimonadales bacterium]
MPFSEDDLRAALRRKEPSADFAAKVMARLGEQPEGERRATPDRRALAVLRWPIQVRWAMAGALAATLLLAAGLQQYQRRQEQVRAERARQQTILALQIATQKIDHVFQRASRTPVQMPVNTKEQL